MSEHNPYKLAPEENQRFFDANIRPNFLESTHEADKPTFILIGGQSGAGKSGLTSFSINEFKQNVIVLDADKYRPQHPYYFKMVKENPEKIFDNARDDVNAWLKKSSQWARENKRHVIMDGTLREKERVAASIQTFKDKGYRTELNILATHERFSHTSIFERYEVGRAASTNGLGRYVDPSFHKSAYEALPRTVKHLEDNKLVDQIRVWDRNGQVIYENNLTNGQWEKQPHAFRSLETERNRLPTPAELNQIQVTREKIISLMEARKAPADEIKKIKEEFQRHPIFELEKKIEAKEVQLKTRYEGPIVAISDKHIIQAVPETGGTVHYQHNAQSFSSIKELRVGDHVSINHLSHKTAIAVQIKPNEKNTPADGMSFEKK